MSNKIVLKKSSVVNKVPTTGDLEYGEVALNYADGKLYYKDNNNQIQSFISGIGAGADGFSFSSISISGQDLVVADSSSDTLNLIAGQGIILTSNATNDSISIASNSAFETFNVLNRISQEITTNLTPLLQNYIRYDPETFRDPVGTVLARTGETLVTG